MVPRISFEFSIHHDVRKQRHSHETLYNGRHGCDFVETQTFSISLLPPQLLPLFLYSGDIRVIVVSLLSPSQAIHV